MTPAARVRDIYLDAARMERAQQIFLPLMEGTDDKAAMIVIRAQERKATLLGSNASLRVDPIALATEVGQPLSSTDQLRAVFDEWRQDIQGREEMAREHSSATEPSSDER
ncbi:MAG TPA: hypothetical protein VFE60_05205 [Roseiarcus sp.]|jgi:hypothetical protein|nr:hypothetical protein [Roseiarcus sp.]